MRFGTLCPDPLLRKQSEEFFFFFFFELASERTLRQNESARFSFAIYRANVQRTGYVRTVQREFQRILKSARWEFRSSFSINKCRDSRQSFFSFEAWGIDTRDGNFGERRIFDLIFDGSSVKACKDRDSVEFMVFPQLRPRLEAKIYNR